MPKDLESPSSSIPPPPAPNNCYNGSFLSGDARGGEAEEEKDSTTFRIGTHFEFTVSSAAFAG